MIIFWATSCELSCRYWTLHQVRDDQTRGTWPKLPQPRELASRTWAQTGPRTEESLYLKQSRRCWSDHHRTSFKMTWADCAVSAWEPPPFIYKSSWPLTISDGESVFGQKSPLNLLASKIKQTLLSINLAFYWLLSGKQPDPTFGYKRRHF